MTLRIAQTDDLATCLALRRVVFMDEQNVPEADEIDGLDPDCVHLLATLDAQPVGTARVYFDGETAKIGRVCVSKAHRRRGIASALVGLALDCARGRARRAKLGAQLDAMPLYARLGFIAEGPVYDDAGIPHRDMVRDL